MKIAIVGTHSTGKSTLLSHLKVALESRGYSVLILPEFARLCPFPINEATTLEAQAWIQSTQIAEEQRLGIPGVVLLCDRSTLDNFAYMARAAGAIDVSHHESCAARHMSTYTYVFKTRALAIPATEDGIRTTDPLFRNEIDERITALLGLHGIPYHVLPATLSYDTHVAYVLDTIWASMNVHT